MQINPPSRSQLVLFTGDAVTLFLVTLYGFAFHETLAAAGGRLSITWLTWLAAWLMIAPHLGVFDPELARRPVALWRPFWAMVLASPVAGFLRAWWLGGQVFPIFVIAFGGIAALAVLAWRVLYLLAARRRPTHG